MCHLECRQRGRDPSIVFRHIGLGDLKAEKRLLKKRKLLRVRIPRVIVKTLCDELGALANDDAERPRAAFRKAAKANHPDDTPGDPDAPHRFRRIVRAHDVLGDEPQRATYDRLLARKPQAKPPVQSATSSLPRSAASFSTPSPVLLSLVSIGTFLLCEHVFRARFHSCARTRCLHHRHGPLRCRSGRPIQSH
jgi:curved DNA-binding protein CbpA